MVRMILAGIVGVVAAFAAVAAAEAIGQQFYPAPVALDLNDRGAMTDYIKAMPIGAFLMIAAGWFLAVLVGAVAAVLLSRSRPRAFALIVGAAVLLAAILNFVFIPHPLWFVVFGLAAVIAAIWPASAIAERIAGATSRPKRHPDLHDAHGRLHANSGMNGISQIGQIAMTVSDVDIALAYYRDVLGLRFLFRPQPTLAFLAAGPVRIMLSTPQGAGTVGCNSILYFKVVDIETLYAAIVARGSASERAPQFAAKMPDHDLWIAFLRDPDGNLIGLMEEKGQTTT